MLLRARIFWPVILLSFFAVFCGVSPAYARVDAPHPPIDPRHADGSAVGGPIDLSSAWLVKQGDDASYAAPQLDDRDWIVVKPPRPLNEYGLKNVDAIWYRTHVHLAPERHNLALLLRNFAGSEQFYVNGVLLGSFGSFAGRGKTWSNDTDVRLAIPDAAVRSGEVTIAIRARIGKESQFGAGAGGIYDRTLLLLGPADVLADASTLQNFRLYTSNVTDLALLCLLALVALSLALTLRSEREYLALFVYAVAIALLGGMFVWTSLTNTGQSPLLDLENGLGDAVYQVALVEFVRIVLRLRRTRLLTIYESLLAFVCFAVFPSINIGFLLSPTGYSNAFFAVVNLFAGIVILPAQMGLPLLAMWTWWKRRNPDALLLLIPLLLQDVLTYTAITFNVLSLLKIAPHDFFPNQSPIQALYVSWWEITNFIASVTLLLFIVLRTVRIARAKAAAAAEIAAAQTVQRVLLARASQPTPGFEVESVYRPASEVGGDFFVVSPGPDGSLVAIVGDVSGKGMTAAMRVSMILGVLRGEESREPSAILRGLNEALLTQGGDALTPGFTTACCVRLEHSGQYSVANAGHIPPYIDGAEIVTGAALPLGLAVAQSYEVTHGQMQSKQKLVLMSDGVVEARSAKGELYGFDRVALLTLKPAEEIAEAAVRFGQEDDITVLTIACCV